MVLKLIELKWLPKNLDLKLKDNECKFSITTLVTLYKIIQGSSWLDLDVNEPSALNLLKNLSLERH